MEKLPTLKPQEIPLDHPDSNNMFQPGPNKPFVATQAAIAMHHHDVILQCFLLLRKKADEHGGLDYLQVFESEIDTRRPLVHRGRPSDHSSESVGLLIVRVDTMNSVGCAEPSLQPSTAPSHDRPMQPPAGRQQTRTVLVTTGHIVKFKQKSDNRKTSASPA